MSDQKNAEWARASAVVLPPLSGSEKQIAWAETIRREMLSPVFAALFRSLAKALEQSPDSERTAMLRRLAENPADSGNWRLCADWAAEQGDSEDQRGAAATRAMGWVLDQISAKFWIDRRRDGNASALAHAQAEAEEYERLRLAGAPEWERLEPIEKLTPAVRQHLPSMWGAKIFGLWEA